MISCKRLILLALVSVVPANTVMAAARPNLLVILADDQGWGDLSVAARDGNRSLLILAMNLADHLATTAYSIGGHGAGMLY